MAAENEYAKLLVIENTVIMRLLRDPAALTEFPFLKLAADKIAAAPKGKGCGKCASKRAGVDYGQLKAVIASLPVEGVVKLKHLLKAQQLRVIYPAGNKTIKKTF